MPAFVPAAARTVALFELFCREQRELGNAEIARALEMADSSCLDLLHTLQQAGWLLRTARTRRYYPTGRLLWAGREIAGHDPLQTAGQEAVDLIADRTGETALCGVLDDGAVRIVAVSQGRHQLRYVLQAGERIALNASALGKALLAQLDPVQAAELLRSKPMRQLTARTLLTPEAVQAAVQSQSRRGWFSADGESVVGVSAYARSGWLGDSLMALSVAGPSERLEQNRQDCLAALDAVVATSFAAGRAPTVP